MAFAVSKMLHQSLKSIQIGDKAKILCYFGENLINIKIPNTNYKIMHPFDSRTKQPYKDFLITLKYAQCITSILVSN